MKRKMLALSKPKLTRNVLFVDYPDISKRTVGTQGPTINKNIETKKKSTESLAGRQPRRELQRSWPRKRSSQNQSRGRGHFDENSRRAQTWATQVFNSQVNKCSEKSENPNEMKWLLDRTTL